MVVAVKVPTETVSLATRVAELEAQLADLLEWQTEVTDDLADLVRMLRDAIDRTG